MKEKDSIVKNIAVIAVASKNVSTRFQKSMQGKIGRTVFSKYSSVGVVFPFIENHLSNYFLGKCPKRIFLFIFKPQRFFIYGRLKSSENRSFSFIKYSILQTLSIR